MPQNTGFKMSHAERDEVIAETMSLLENAGSLIASVGNSLDHDGFEQAAEMFAELTDQITRVRMRLEKLPR